MVLKQNNPVLDKRLLKSLNPTVVVLKLWDEWSRRGGDTSQSNRSGFETALCERPNGQGGCLNPTVVVLKP